MPPTILILVSVSWFGLWLFVPGLMENSLGTRLFSDDQAGLLFDIALAGVVLGILYALHQRFNRLLFKKQPTIWLFLLPLVALLVMPIRAGGIDGEVFNNPAWLYALMMLVNVVYQQYVTFGLLQSYLRTVLPATATVVLTAVIFYMGHSLLLPGQFGPAMAANAVFIIVLGVIFASLRQKTGTLHANIALHLAFYFLLI